MNYETLEDDIVTQLRAAFTADGGPAADIMPLADNQSEYKLAFDKPKIFVCYQKSEFSPSKSSGPIVQQETPKVAVMIQAGTRRGTAGVFNTFERCRLALMNFSPSNMSALWCDKLEFSDYKDNVWCYDFSVAGYTWAVSFVPDETGPLAGPPQQNNSDPQFN